ncbi:MULTISPECIES: helix-turn-helix transcriptional regulator [Actinomycetes]|uniref:PadR family transcriptional regulator n=1 Tax=Actinomycetes TaxID=1760 RepID=UPI0004BFDDC7|nr:MULTISPECIES: helix-turn-helix transcriptional regulator [Actinomycetes]
MTQRGAAADVELTPLAVLVLGLAAERPMHAYEMVQTLLERNEDRFAKTRPGSLYHTVDRLHTQDLLQINSVQRSGNRPERTVYAITETGTRALRHSLMAMLRTPAVEYPSFYLALAEAHSLGRHEVVGLLTERLGAMRDELESVNRSVAEASEGGIPEMFLLDAGCRQAVMQAQIAWTENLRVRLENGDILWIEEWLARTTPSNRTEEDSE